MAFDFGGAERGLGIGGLLGSLYGGQSASNPFEAAQRVAGQYGPELQAYKNYLTPYAQQYGGALSQMMSNPTGLLDHIMNHYHQSPFAHDQTQLAQHSAESMAALHGDVGTPQEQEAVAQRVGQIGDADQERYLHDAMSQYNRGLQGMGGLESQLPGELNMEGNYLGNMANLASAGTDWQNRQQGGFMKGLGGLAGGVLGGFL